MIARDGDDLRIAGELTIRGVTPRDRARGRDPGTGRDDDGLERVGLELTGRLDRRDHGLTRNTVIDGGGLLVGNRVDLQLEVSAIRQDGGGPS